jgi:hypothetical protein
MTLWLMGHATVRLRVLGTSDVVATTIVSRTRSISSGTPARATIRNYVVSSAAHAKQSTCGFRNLTWSIAFRSVAHGDLPTETIAEPVLFHFDVIAHLQV